jgi:hypothetical protein
MLRRRGAAVALVMTREGGRRPNRFSLAGVKTLVLSHFVPPDDPEVTDQMWVDAARVHFRGPVIVGKTC